MFENFDVSKLMLVVNLTFILILVIAALIGYLRGIYRAGFRFLFVLGTLIALWFLSPGIIDELLAFPIKEYVKSYQWDIETLAELPKYLIDNNVLDPNMIAAMNNEDLLVFMNELMRVLLTFIIFFIGGVFIVILSWPISTLLYGILHFLIPKKLRKQHKVRIGGAFFGVLQALVSISIMLMPISVINDAVAKIDRKNLEGNKEILTIYDLTTIYGNSFLGQFFKAIQLPFQNQAKVDLWASDRLLTMQFKTKSIVLTDEIGLFMDVFDELLKAGYADLVYEANTGNFTVYFNAEAKDIQLPNGKFALDNPIDLGSSYQQYYTSHSQYNPYLWDYSSLGNPFNLPYLEAGYVYENGQLVMNPAFTIETYLEKLGFSMSSEAIDPATLEAYIKSVLPNAKFEDPSTWSFLFAGQSNGQPYQAQLNLDQAWELGVLPEGLSSILAYQLPFININFNTWEFSYSAGNENNQPTTIDPKIVGEWQSDFNLGSLPTSGGFALQDDFLESFLSGLTPELASTVLNLISDSELVTNLLPVAVDIALVLPALEDYIDASEINPDDLAIDWEVELKQLAVVAEKLLALDVINNEDYAGYDPDTVEQLGIELGKLKLVTQIVPAALPGILPNVIDPTIYSGLKLDEVNFDTYDWDKEMTQIAKIAATALLLDVRGIADGTIDYYTQNSSAVATILNTIADSELFMTILPNAAEYALALPEVTAYTKNIDIDLTGTDWSAELVRLGSVYGEIAKVGGDPLDVKWGLTDAETAAKAAAIEAAIDILFESQLINSLLPTLTDIGINYINPPFDSAIDPTLIDFEDLNLSQEMINAFRIYRLVIDEENQLNVAIRSYSDTTIQTIASYIAASDIIVPLLPHAIDALATEYNIDQYVDIDETVFRNINWEKTIYGLVGVAGYFLNDANQPNINIAALSDENITDIATKLGDVDLLKKLFPSALEKLLISNGYGDYYEPDMVDFAALDLGKEAGHILRVLKVLGFMLDENNQPSMDLNILYFSDEMLSLIETELNGSDFFKQLGPVIFDIIFQNLPAEYRSFFDVTELNFDLIHLGSEIRSLLEVMRALGSMVDLENGTFQFNRDFSTYTDSQIEAIGFAFENSQIFKQLIPMGLRYITKMLMMEYDIFLDLQTLLKDIYFGKEIVHLLYIARDISLKITDDNSTVSFNQIITSYSDIQIAEIARNVGDSDVMNILLEPVMKQLIPKLDIPVINESVDFDQLDYEQIDLEAEINAIGTLAQYVLNNQNQFELQSVTNEAYESVAAKLNQSYLLRFGFNEGLKIAKTYLSDEFNFDLDLTAIGQVSWQHGSELVRFIKVANDLHLSITTEPFGFTLDTQIYLYSDERIDNIAKQLGNSEMIKALFPQAIDFALTLIPSDYAKYKDLIYRDSIIEENLNLETEIAGFGKIATILFNEQNEIVLQANALSDEDIDTISIGIGNSGLVKMLLDDAVDHFARNSEDYLDLNIDEYVNLTSVDYRLLDLVNELDSLLTIARDILGNDNASVIYKIPALRREEIKNSINKMTLIKKLLPSVMVLNASRPEVQPYVDLNDLVVEELDLGNEVKGILEILYHFVDEENHIEPKLSALKNDNIVELIGTVVSDSKIIKQLAPGAINKAFNLPIFDQYGIDLNRYIDVSNVNVDYLAVDWGNEVKAILYLAAAVAADSGNDLDYELNIESVEYTKVATNFNQTTFIPHLIKSAYGNINTILYDYVEKDTVDLIRTFVDFDQIEVDDLAWGTEITSILRLIAASINLEKVDDTISYSIDYVVSDNDIALTQIALNQSVLLPRIVKNVIAVTTALEYSIPQYLPPIVPKDYYAFNIDFQQDVHIGDEVANLMYIFREFLAEDGTFTLDFTKLTNEFYAMVASKLNQLKLLPIVAEAAATIAVQALAISYQDFLFPISYYVSLDDVDFASISYGDEIVKLAKTARIFVNQEKMEFFPKFDFYEEEMETIASNLGTSELVNIIVEKGIIGGLKLIGYETYAEDLDVNTWDLTSEISHVLHAINALDVNIEQPFKMLDLHESQITMIEEHLSGLQTLQDALPLIFAYSIDKAEKKLQVEISDYINISEEDYLSFDLGLEIGNILRVLQYIDFTIEMEPTITIDFNQKIATYDDGIIDIIASLVGQSRIIDELLPAAIEVGWRYIPTEYAEYKAFIDKENFDASRIDLEKEISSFAKIAKIFMNSENVFTVQFNAISNEQIDLIAQGVGQSDIVNMLINYAVNHFADVSDEYLAMAITNFVELKGIDYASLDLTTEIKSILTIARNLLTDDNQGICFRVEYLAREEIKNSIDQMKLPDLLLPSVIQKNQDKESIATYVDLGDIVLEEIDLGSEVKGALDVLYYFVDDANVIQPDITKLQESFLVELISEVVGNSNLMKQLAPSAIHQAFANPGLQDINIDLQRYLDEEALSTLDVDWGKEVKALLSLAGAVGKNIDQESNYRLAITDVEYQNIQTSFANTTFLPHLMENGLNHLPNILEDFVTDEIVDLLTYFISIEKMDFSNLTWEQEIVSVLKLVDSLLMIQPERDMITVMIDPELTDLEIEAIRNGANNSELLVRVVENVIDVVSHNGYRIEETDELIIPAEYYDFTQIDFRNQIPLGDEIAHFAYIARTFFVAEDNLFEIDVSKMDDAFNTLVKEQLNASKLVPFAADAMSHVALDVLGIRYQENRYMIRDYISLDDVDFSSIAYGDEAVKLIKAAKVFLNESTMEFELKLDFTEAQMETISSNLGSSELIRIALKKVMVGGLGLFRLDSEGLFDEVEYDSLDLAGEFHSLLQIVNALDVNFEQPLKMLEVSDDQITTITQSLQAMKTIRTLTPIAVAFGIDRSSQLFGFDLRGFFDVSLVDFDVIDWGNELGMVLTAARYFVLEDGTLGLPSTLEELHVSEVAEKVKPYLNASKLVPQVARIVLQKMNTYEYKFSDDLQIKISDYIDVNQLNYDSYRYGDELVNLVEIAKVFVQNDFSYYVTLDLTESEFDTIETRINQSSLLNDVFENALNTSYEHNVFRVQDLVELPSTFDFSGITWGTEISELARIAKDYVQVEIAGDTVEYALKLASTSDEQIARIQAHINASKLLPPLIEGAIHALDTNYLLEEQYDFDIKDYVDVNTLDLSGLVWGDEIASLMKIGRVFVEDEAFVLRYKLSVNEIVMIEDAVKASVLINRFAPLALEVADAHIESIYDYRIDDYIDLARIDLTMVDLSAEVGAALRLAALVFDENNTFTFNFHEIDTDFIESVRTNLNRSLLIKQVTGLMLEKYVAGNYYAINDYVDLSGFDSQGYSYGDEAATLLKLAQIFVTADESGQSGFTLKYDPSLSDNEISLVENLVNHSPLINDLLPRFATRMYDNNYENIQMYINLDAFNYDGYLYGTELVNVLRVAREILILEDDGSYSFDTIFSLEDESITVIENAIAGSTLIPEIVPLVIEKLPNFEIAGINIADIIDVNDILPQLDTLMYGTEAGIALRLLRIYDKVVEDAKIVNLGNELIEEARVQINASTFLKIIAQPLLDRAMEVNRNSINDWLDVSKLNIDDLALGDEFAHLALVAKEFYHFDDAVFTTQKLAALSEERVHFLAQELNASKLLERVVPLLAEKFDTNEHIMDLLQMDFDLRDYVEASTLDFTDIQYGDEFLHAYNVANYFTNDFANYEWSLSKITPEAIATIQAELNASLLLKRVMPNVLAQEATNELYDLTSYVDFSSATYDDILWGDEVANALEIAVKLVDVNDQWDITPHLLTSENINLVRSNVNASKLFNRLAPSMISLASIYNTYGINEWVDVSNFDTTGIIWGDEIADLLEVVKVFTLDGQWNLHYNFTDDEIAKMKNTFNESLLFNQVIDSAITLFAEYDRFDVSYYMDGLATMDFSNIRWGDEVEHILKVANLIAYDDGELKLYYPYSDEEIAVIKQEVNASMLLPMIDQKVIDTFAVNDVFGINSYVDIAGLDVASVNWGNEVELVLKTISTFSPTEGAFELVFTNLLDEQIEALASLVDASTLITMLAPRMMDKVYEQDLYDLDSWLDQSVISYDTIDYGVEVETALRVLRILLNQYGEVLTNVNFTDEQILEVKTHVGYSTLIPMLAPNLLEHVTTNGIYLDPTWIDMSSMDYTMVDYDVEVERIMKTLRELDDGSGSIDQNIAHLSDAQIDVIAENLGNSEFVKQLGERVIERSIALFEVPYIEFSDLDFTDVVYENEIANLLKAYKRLVDENGEVDVDTLTFASLEANAHELSLYLGSSKLITSALPTVLPRMMPYDEVTFPYDLTKVDYSSIDWTIEIEAMIHLLASVGADLEGNFTFDFENTERAKVVELGSYLSDTKIGQLIVSSLIEEAIVSFNFAGITSEDLDFNQVTDWGAEIVRLYDIIQIVVDENGDAKDFATIAEADADVLAQNLGASELFVMILPEVIKNTITDAGYGSKMPVEKLDFSAPLDWTAELQSFFGIYRIMESVPELKDLSVEKSDELSVDLGTSKILKPVLPDVIKQTVIDGGLDDMLPVEQLYFGNDTDPLDWEAEFKVFFDIYRKMDAINFDFFTLADLDNAEVLLTRILDSDVIYTNAYPYVFANAAEKMSLNEIEGANFSLEFLKTNIHLLGKVAWIDEITALCDLYREVNDLGGIAGIQTMTLQSIEEKGKDAATVFETISNLVLDSKILGITTLEPIVFDMLDLGNDSSGNPIPLASTSGWTTADWRVEISQLKAVIIALEAISPTYDFAAVSLDSNEGNHNLAMGVLLNAGYDSSLLATGMNIKIRDVIMSYNEITDYVNVNKLDSVRTLLPGTDEEGWIGEIVILQSLRSHIEGFNLDDPSSMSGAELNVVLDEMKASYLLNDGLPNVIKNALIGVGVDDMINKTNPGKFDSLNFMMVKDPSNNEEDQLAALYTSIKEIGDLANVDWKAVDSSSIFAEVVKNLVRCDLFSGTTGEPSSSNPAHADDPDVLLIAGIFDQASLNTVLDAEKVITLAGDDVLHEDDYGYTPVLVTELDLVRELKVELFTDAIGNEQATLNYNKITADALKSVNLSSIVKENALPDMLKEGLKTISFDSYVGITAFETMNFAGIKDDVEIDRVMELYDFIKLQGSMELVDWNSLSNDVVANQLTIITTSIVMQPVRGILVNKILTSIGFAGYYTEQNIMDVEAADGWAKEVEAIRASLALAKQLDNPTSKLTYVDSYAVRAMMIKADETILMNQIIKGILNEQMVTLGVSEAEFTWSNKDLGDTSAQLAALIDLSKLITATSSAVAPRKLANNFLGNSEFAFDITKPMYKDETKTQDRIQRIFYDLEADGNPSGREVVDALNEAFMNDALPVSGAFDTVDWSTIDYVNEGFVLTNAAFLDMLYLPGVNRPVGHLVDTMNRFYTLNGSIVTYHAPLAASLLQAMDARLYVTAAEYNDVIFNWAPAEYPLVQQLLINTIYVVE